MRILRLLDRLKKAEDLKLVRYQDHKKVWTIGYGTTHFLGERVTPDWPKITKKRALDMLHLEVMNSYVAAAKSVSNFDEIGNIRQEALVELVYQLGERGWLLFKNTRKFIEQPDWLAASVEIKDSDLWRDKRTRTRCERYAAMLLFGNEYSSLMDRHKLELILA